MKKLFVVMIALFPITAFAEEVVYDELGHRVQSGDEKRPPKQAQKPVSEEEEASDGAQTHDGFFLRMMLGGGFTGIKNKGLNTGSATFEAELSGGSGDFQLEIGSMIFENLGIFAKIGSNVIQEPDLKMESDTMPLEFPGKDVTARLTTFGPGATYYFDLINLYVSASVLVTQFTLEWGGLKGESSLGVLGNFAIGKEWWVSDNWGLGIAGQFFSGKIPEQDDEKDQEPWEVTGFTISFSATYN